MVRGEEKYLGHVLDLPLSFDVFRTLQPVTPWLGTTPNFRKVVDTFDVPASETPAGFRIEFALDSEAVMRVDLVRGIGYDRNGQNVSELLEGDKRFKRRYDAGSTGDLSRGHRLALLLREHGYRVNFTLMFEPYQTALALQARPYFINSFIRQRLMQGLSMQKCLDLYAASQEAKHLADLRALLVDKDYLSPEEGTRTDLLEAKRLAESILRDRRADDPNDDGLDSVRHNLRVLRQCRPPDTRLNICSMEGEKMYPDIDRLLAEPEFVEMADRVVITAEPAHLAVTGLSYIRFSS
ncbi:MAG: hypothetical protein IMZ69_05625 [Spirochaetes bacterium]|nr:hypothetical protein [Spirochaetota bacterium]